MTANYRDAMRQRLGVGSPPPPANVQQQAVDLAFRIAQARAAQKAAAVQQATAPAYGPVVPAQMTDPRLIRREAGNRPGFAPGSSLDPAMPTPMTLEEAQATIPDAPPQATTAQPSNVGAMIAGMSRRDGQQFNRDMPGFVPAGMTEREADVWRANQVFFAPGTYGNMAKTGEYPEPGPTLADQIPDAAGAVTGAVTDYVGSVRDAEGIGGTIQAAAMPVLEVASAPNNWLMATTGDDMYESAMSGGDVGWFENPVYQSWDALLPLSEWTRDPVNKNDIRLAHDYGLVFVPIDVAEADGAAFVTKYELRPLKPGEQAPEGATVLTGGDAVFMLYLNENHEGWLNQTIAQTAFDPLILGTVAAKFFTSLGRITSGSERLGALSTGATVAGETIETLNRIPDLPFEMLGRGLSGAARRARIGPSAATRRANLEAQLSDETGNVSRNTGIFTPPSTATGGTTPFPGQPFPPPGGGTSPRPGTTPFDAPGGGAVTPEYTPAQSELDNLVVEAAPNQAPTQPELVPSANVAPEVAAPIRTEPWTPAEIQRAEQVGYPDAVRLADERNAAMATDMPDVTGRTADAPVSGPANWSTLSPQDRSRAIQSGQISSFTPVYRGERLVDRAYTASIDDPAMAPQWQAFQTEVAPVIKQHDTYVRRPFDPAVSLEERALQDTIAGMEIVVNTIAPAYARHFPGESFVPTVAARRANLSGKSITFLDESGSLTARTPAGNTVRYLNANKPEIGFAITGHGKRLVVRPAESGQGWAVFQGSTKLADDLNDLGAMDFVDSTLGPGAASYSRERIPFLIERAVYAGDDRAYSVLSSRLRSMPNGAEMIARVDAARSRMRQLQGAVDVSPLDVVEPPPPLPAQQSNQPSSGRGVESFTDIAAAPRVAPDGRRLLYVGRTADDTPTRIVEAPPGSRSQFEVEYAAPSVTSGERHNIWTLQDDVGGLVGITDPNDLIGQARLALSKVEQLRAQLENQRARGDWTVRPDADVQQMANDLAERAAEMPNAADVAPTATQPSLRPSDLLGGQRAQRVADIPTEDGRLIPRGTRRELDGDLYVYTKASIDDIRTDTGSFQNRKAAYSEQSVKNILANYNPRKFEPIEVMENADGSYTVLSGHSRLEAWTRMAANGRVSATDVPIRIQQGTADELRLLAQTSNTRGTANTPTEKGRLIRTLVDGGMDWTDALREVNVNSAEGKRLVFLTNLSDELQGYVDTGKLSVNQGSTLGEYIEKNVLTTGEADNLYLNTISTTGMSDVDLRDFLTTAARMKEQSQSAQTGMFAGMDLGDSGFAAAADKMIDLNRKVRALRSQERSFKRAAKSDYLDITGKESISRAMASLRLDIAGLENDLGITPPAAGPSGQASAASRLRDYWEKPIGIVADPRALTVTDDLVRWYESLGPEPKHLLDTDYVDDPTPLGQAFNAGDIDAKTYEFWSEQLPVEVRGEAIASQRADLMFQDLLAKNAYDFLETEKQFIAILYNARNLTRKYGVIRRALRRTELGRGVDGFARGLYRFPGETLLYNALSGVQGISGDLFGDLFRMLVERPKAALGTFNMRSLFNLAVGLHKNDAARAIAPISWIEDAYEFTVPRKLTLGHVRETGEASTGSAMTLNQALNAITGNNPIMNKINAVIAEPIQSRILRDIRQGWDLLRRQSVYEQTFKETMAVRRKAFREAAMERADSYGVPRAMTNKAINDLGRHYGPSMVRERMRRLGDAAGLTTWQRDTLASDLTKSWRAEIREASDGAFKEQNRILLSYERTNVDEAVGKVFLFHYWMSRSYPNYVRMAFRNPWLMALYVRSSENMSRDAEAMGIPANSVLFAGDPMGWGSVLFPDRVVNPLAELMTDITRSETGDKPIVERAMEFGALHPMVGAFLAGVGLIDRPIDPTGLTPFMTRLDAGVAYLQTKGILPGDPSVGASPWQDVVRTFYGALAKDADRLMRDPNAFRREQLVYIMAAKIAEQTGRPFNVEDAEQVAMLNAAVAAMEADDESNPIYAAAFDEQAEQRAAGFFMPPNFAIPGGVQVQYGPQMAGWRGAEQGFDALNTVEGPTPNQQDAMTFQQISRSGSPESYALNTGLAQLNRLGTEDGRQGYTLWNDIAYGEFNDPSESIQIGDQVFYGWQLKKMNVDQRKDLADLWLAQYEGVPEQVDDYREKRTAFLAEHPEVGDFKEYQNGVYNYEKGGPKGWRTMFARDPENADFAAAMKKAEDRLRAEGKTGTVLDAELDQWAASQAAYKVANGYQASVYDPPVDPRVPDYRFDAGQETGTTTKKSAPKDPMEQVRDTITSWQKKLDDGLAAMRAAGYDVTEEDVIAGNPYYDAVFAQYGVPQSVPEDVWLFWSWKNLQPAGAYLTVDDYLRYLQMLGAQVAA